jgi:hypothetical protein
MYLYVVANGSRTTCSSPSVLAYGAACDFDSATNRPVQVGCSWGWAACRLLAHSTLLVLWRRRQGRGLRA